MSRRPITFNATPLAPIRVERFMDTCNDPAETSSALPEAWTTLSVMLTELSANIP
ncbi:hypothetical protein D3C72_1425680 [compost metagenome]